MKRPIGAYSSKPMTTAAARSTSQNRRPRHNRGSRPSRRSRHRRSSPRAFLSLLPGLPCESLSGVYAGRATAPAPVLPRADPAQLKPQVPRRRASRAVPAKKIEFETKHQTYCHQLEYSILVPPRFIHRDVATCVTCQRAPRTSATVLGRRPPRRCRGWLNQTGGSGATLAVASWSSTTDAVVTLGLVA